MNFRKMLIACFAAAVAVTVSAADYFVLPSGKIKIAGLDSYMTVVTKSWVGCQPGKTGFFKTTGKMQSSATGRKIQGLIGDLAGAHFKFTEDVTFTGASSFDLSINLQSAAEGGVPCHRVYYVIRVPEGELKGKNIKLNGTEEAWAPNETIRKEIGELEFCAKGKRIKITGDFCFMTQAGWGTASLIIGFAPFNGTITEGGLELSVEVLPL